MWALRTYVTASVVGSQRVVPLRNPHCAAACVLLAARRAYQRLHRVPYCILHTRPGSRRESCSSRFLPLLPYPPAHTPFLKKDGTVLRHGNAKTLPLKTAASLDAAFLGASAPASASASASAAPGGEEGEQQKENDAAAANASSASANAGKAAPGVECEGGVCKLVRKPKKAEPEASARQDPAPAAPPAAAAAGRAPAPAPRTIECEGGVCKLVRKPKEPVAAAAVEKKKPEEAEAGQPPLAVGDTMPVLQVKEAPTPSDDSSVHTYTRFFLLFPPQPTSSPLGMSTVPRLLFAFGVLLSVSSSSLLPPLS